MRIVLRIFITLMVILAGVSLWLGIVLFQQREQLKGRTQNLERSLQFIADRAGAGEDPHIEALPDRLDPNALRDYFRMEGQIATVNTMVTNRYRELLDTRIELAKTKQELEITRDELARTKAELDAANRQIASLTSELEQTRAELASANQQIEQLLAEKADLERNVQEKTDQIAKLEEEKQGLIDEKTQLEVMLERLTPPDRPAPMKPGLQGTVVTVNPEWNFVVLDVGLADGAKVSGEMIVHRNSQVVGKVRIRDIRKSMSIADIKRDWQQMPIQEGDRVVY